MEEEDQLIHQYLVYSSGNMVEVDVSLGCAAFDVSAVMCDIVCCHLSPLNVRCAD